MSRTCETVETMTSPNADRKELKRVQKRISELMRDYATEQEQRQNLLNTIQSVSSSNIQLMSASASSSRRNRQRTDTTDMRTTINELQRQLTEKEAVIGRLWNKLAELQERERELEAQTQGYY